LKQSKVKEEEKEEWPAISYPFSYIKGDLPSSDSDYEVEDELPAPTNLPEVVQVDFASIGYLICIHIFKGAL
jgi:hypothetical protein